MRKTENGSYIKDHLQRNNMTQKEFMLGLIENELDRDLTQRAEEIEALQEYTKNTENGIEAASGKQDESEYMGMGMSMRTTLNDLF